MCKITVLGLMGNSVFLRVPHFHSAGETLQASSLYMEPGGKGCNQAVAAERLGATVNFLSCMGRDNTAKDCLSFMESEGITCYTQYISDTASPYACILTDRSGENQVTVHAGSAGQMSASFVESCEDAIASSDILLLNNECPQEANEAALALALQHNVRAVLNPAPYRPLSRDYINKFSLITPNRHEAAMLSSLPVESHPEDLLRSLLDLGVQGAVITLGGEGAILWDGKKILPCPAVPVKATDTTGAGDCFNGALCCGLGDGLSIEKATGLAIKASAYSVERQFVMSSLPHLYDL